MKTSMKRFTSAGTLVLAVAAIATPATAAAGSGPITQEQRAKAVHAARHAVPGSGERVLEVYREHHEHPRGEYCVELAKGGYVYDVDLTRDFKVIDVEREGGGGDD